MRHFKIRPYRKPQSQRATLGVSGIEIGAMAALLVGALVSLLSLATA